MQTQKKPPSIEFYESESASVSTNRHSLTRFVRVCSFGIIKTDTQASVVLLILIAAGLFASYYFARESKTVTPTTHFELLPQESVGSSQGLPPTPDTDYE